jgi:hypothetical protein
MKHISFFSFATSLLLLAVCATLFSFSSKKGGDSFTIHLGSQLLLQQYVFRDKAVRNVSLKNAPASESLMIQYSHCGKIGTGRTLTLRDGDRILKTWHFPDANGETSPAMRCTVKELTATIKPSAALVYTSNELPEGRTLAIVTSGDERTASLR